VFSCLSLAMCGILHATHGDGGQTRSRCPVATWRDLGSLGRSLTYIARKEDLFYAC